MSQVQEDKDGTVAKNVVHRSKKKKKPWRLKGKIISRFLGDCVGQQQLFFIDQNISQIKQVEKIAAKNEDIEIDKWLYLREKMQTSAIYWHEGLRLNPTDTGPMDLANGRNNSMSCSGVSSNPSYFAEGIGLWFGGRENCHCEGTSHI